MIAIFAPVRDLRNMRKSKVNNIIFVRSTKDIRGGKFTGIIQMRGWWEREELTDAFEMLIERQPELNKFIH